MLGSDKIGQWINDTKMNKLLFMSPRITWQSKEFEGESIATLTYYGLLSNKSFDISKVNDKASVEDRRRFHFCLFVYW